jgi:hypothetical protein
MRRSKPKVFTIKTPAFHTHCPECRAEFINHQACGKAPGVIGYRECNCVQFSEEIKPCVTEYYSVPFKILQHYECVIQSVEKETFWAKLIDKTNVNESDEEAEFLTEKIPEGERSYIQPGAVFDWYIGDGKFKIRFRKAVWTKELLDEAHKRAEELKTKVMD